MILDSDFQFKGALTENYLIQQLQSQLDIFPHYYSSVQNYEIDFLMQSDDEIIPIECKAGGNVASASFMIYFFFCWATAVSVSPLTRHHTHGIGCFGVVSILSQQIVRQNVPEDCF
ncbi:MAG: DUF4143 domain-containing protein [Treponema sp.]|nr:DUF4143 domain-containing protein [Treponema sp.]